MHGNDACPVAVLWDHEKRKTTVRIIQMAISIGSGKTADTFFCCTYTENSCVVVLNLLLDVPTLTGDYSPLIHMQAAHTFEARHLRDDETLSAERVFASC